MAALVLIDGTSAAAQGVRREVDATDRRWSLELLVRERSLAEAARAHFPTRDQPASRFNLDSVRAAPSFGPQAYSVFVRSGAGETHFTVDRAGRLLSGPASTGDGKGIRHADPSRGPLALRLGPSRWNWGLLAYGGVRASIAMLPERPRVGARERLPVRERVDSLGLRVRVDGTRWLHITGDTVIDGRRHWIVLDSAELRIVEEVAETGRSFRDPTWATRRHQGTLVGRSIVEDGFPIVRARRDSLALTGTVSRRSPGGTAIRARERYDGVLSITRRDSAEQREHLAAAARESRREGSGPVWVPRNSTEQRLAGGDAALFDSLAQDWRRATSAATRDSAWEHLSSRSAGIFHERLDAVRLEEGDSAILIRPNAYIGEHKPMSDSIAALAISVVRDPARAMRWGVDEDTWIRHLSFGISDHPIGMPPEDTASFCEPAACARFAALWPHEGDERLRDIGLLTRFVLDPARWLDTLRERAPRSATSLLDQAVALAGDGAVILDWTHDTIGPVPAIGAVARDWLSWLRGPGERYGWSPIHRQRVRLATLVQGRNLPAEFRRSRAVATAERDRAIFSHFLLDLGAESPVTDSIAAHLRSSVPESRRLAQAELETIRRRSRLDPNQRPVLDPAVRVELTRALLASISARTSPPWPDIQAPDRPRTTSRRPSDTSNVHMILRSETVPPELHASLPRGIELMTSADWAGRSPREAGLISQVDIQALADGIVEVSLTDSGMLAVDEDEAPHHYQSGRHWVLMRLDGEWHIVSSGYWIT